MPYPCDRLPAHADFCRLQGRFGGGCSLRSRLQSVSPNTEGGKKDKKERQAPTFF
ncbi:MAG: hypothetical protein Q8L87_09825 [Anaerolineales bacterium]|nr:hypothetical protein [Anaerolineales bacterium]